MFYPKIIQQLADAEESLNEARSWCSVQKDEWMFMEIMKVSERIEQLQHVCMTSGSKEKSQ